jgi:hypothetical protein
MTAWDGRERRSGHKEVLPECETEHSIMWQVVWGASASFLVILCIAIPIVVANVNELKAEDSKIRSEHFGYISINEAERARLTAERNKAFADMNQKIADGFTEIKVQLAEIKTELKKK